VQQRGATLLEVLLATAIAIMIGVAAFGFSAGARALGARSAVSQFDAALAYAHALAANSGNGATLVFNRRISTTGAPLRGFKLTIYSGRPTSAGALQPSSLAPLESQGDVSERLLGAVPFAIFLNGAGHASALGGTISRSTLIATDPGCPSGETSVVLIFADPRSSEVRRLPCKTP
jgi:type II secretory pathway pseudopilin PulG